MAEQEANATVSCSGCGASVPEPGRIEDREPCPTCGSLARTINVRLTGTVQARERLNLKARHGDVGEVKPYREQTSGDELHRDSGEWRRVSRVVDCEHDRYTERIVDAAGNVVRDVDEPLSEHQGRGAAKPRPPTDSTP
jgi:predicted RNA-binding Zn-ribbon protein involved in translation (DUF1610 family)